MIGKMVDNIAHTGDNVEVHDLSVCTTLKITPTLNNMLRQGCI